MLCLAALAACLAVAPARAVDRELWVAPQDVGRQDPPKDALRSLDMRCIAGRADLTACLMKDLYYDLMDGTFILFGRDIDVRASGGDTDADIERRFDERTCAPARPCLVSRTRTGNVWTRVALPRLRDSQLCMLVQGVPGRGAAQGRILVQVVCGRAATRNEHVPGRYAGPPSAGVAPGRPGARQPVARQLPAAGAHRAEVWPLRGALCVGVVAARLGARHREPLAHARKVCTLAEHSPVVQVGRPRQGVPRRQPRHQCAS